MSARASRISGVLAVLFSCLAASPALAQDAIDLLLGQVITAVELQVEGQPETSAPLLALIDIKPGERFTIAAYRRVADRFNQVPRFENVRVLAAERPAGLVLIFDLEPRHPVDRMEFPGEDTGLTPAELQRQVRDLFNGLPALTRRTDVEAAVRRILIGEGYLSAAVTSDIVRFHDPDRSTLNVHVRAGPRITIGKISIEGESPLSRDEVLKELGLASGRPYRERALEAGLVELQDDLRARGYYSAVAQSVPVVPAGPSVDVTLRIEAGPLVRVRVEGPLPGSQDDYIPIKRQGSVDLDLLDASREEIEAEWKRRGYWRTSVSYTITDPAPDERLVTFVIDLGKRYRIMRVELPADLHFTPADLEALAALQVGAWFSQDAVSMALVVLKALYQQDGYWNVVIKPEYEEVPGRSPDEGGVVVKPNIVEGPRAVIAKIAFAIGEKPTVTEAELRAILRSKEQTPPASYVAGNFKLDQQTLITYYESRGFLNSTVSIAPPEFNAAGTEAVLRVTGREGPRVLVSEITVVGNDRVKPEIILKQMTLKVGQPYSESARVDSQRRLYTLDAFSSARVDVQRRLPGETEARILVSVVESGAVTFGFGGGVEAGTTARLVEEGGVEDRLEFSPRASFDIGRRNLGGLNRAVNFFSRVSLRPKSSEDPALDGKGYAFNEYRVNATYRDRNAFGVDTDLLFGATTEQAVRTTYSFLRRGVNADILRPLSTRVSVSGRYSLEVTRLFDTKLSEEDRSLIDRLFPQIRLSIFSGALLWDRRDSQIAASRGSLVTATLDYGPRFLGSEVGFIKSFIEGSVYRRLRPNRRAILAMRAQVGLARGFERRVPRIDDNGLPVLDPDGTQIIDIIRDLPASQRFFAGGSNSVRGFQLDRLGVPEILDANGLSDGGNAMMVLNTELRLGAGRLLGRALTVVGFVDGGNVFDRIGEMNLSRLRATTGFGFRYDSQVGPIRLDVGVKLDRFTFARGRERRWELHLSIGEVF
jgi:outer membrane protein insertion porin family